MKKNTQVRKRTAKTSAAPYFGADLSTLDCERLMIERFAVTDKAFIKLLGQEVELMQTKWFDYRLIHPVKATYLYAAEYSRIFKRYYSEIIDVDKARRKTGFRGRDFWKSKEFSGFWRGRWHADRLGMPYWFFISKAFECLYIRKWKHIPRPAHLYSEVVLEFVTQAWAEYAQSAIVFAENPFFRDPQNAHAPIYKNHEHWVGNRIRRSSAPRFALRQYAVEERMLSKQYVMEAFAEHHWKDFEHLLV